MEREVTVDGLKIRYLEEGTGTPVIMLHGASLGSSADVFARHLGPLADAGFGLSRASSRTSPRTTLWPTGSASCRSS